VGRPPTGARYSISASRFRRSGLELPDELLAAFGAEAAEVSVLVLDEEDERYALYIDIQAGMLKGGDLRKWYGRHIKTGDETIIVEVIDSSGDRVRLTTDGANQAAAPGLHLGRQWSMIGAVKDSVGSAYYLDPERLLTHVFVCGATGSGKTVLAKALLEEVLLRNVPCVAIDLKGDISSMALWIDSEDPVRVENWMAGDTIAQRRSAAQEELREHWRRHDEATGRDAALRTAQQLSSQVRTVVYTPRVSRGVQLGFPAAVAAPADLRGLQKAGELDELVRTVTDAFLDRLYPSTRRQKIENERSFLFELVKASWLQGENLHGKPGIARLLRLIEDPPFSRIGELPVPQYIDAENRRNRLLNKVNGLISGPDAQWFEGTPLNIELFLPTKEDQRVPLSIINLSDVTEFEDRSFVVAQVANTIRNWMRTLQGTSSPRLLLFVDEIGGGGGKQALFASHPYECAAKWGLNYLVRQGRSFGVCVMLATQNPGDVDYRAVSNCGTQMIGRLGTKRDRAKALESASLSGSVRTRVDAFLTDAGPGDFAVLPGGNRVDYIRSRWINSLHLPIAPSEIGRLMQDRG
jgi:predicted ATPase